MFKIFLEIKRLLNSDFICIGLYTVHTNNTQHENLVSQEKET